jgi:hypothetical protein
LLDIPSTFDTVQSPTAKSIIQKLLPKTIASANKTESPATPTSAKILDTNLDFFRPGPFITPSFEKLSSLIPQIELGSPLVESSLFMETIENEMRNDAPQSIEKMNSECEPQIEKKDIEVPIETQGTIEDETSIENMNIEVEIPTENIDSDEKQSPADSFLDLYTENT